MRKSPPKVLLGLQVPKDLMEELREAAANGLGEFRLSLTSIVERGIRLALDELKKKKKVIQ